MIDLGNCGVPEFAREYREMGGFIAYLPAALRELLGEPALEAMYKELLAHEVWVRHKFRIGAQILEGKRDSLVLCRRPQNADRAEFPLEHFSFAALLLRVAEALTGCEFQAILIHRYDPVKHSLGFHSDETHTETYDGHGQVIVSMSLGARRQFDIKYKHPKNTNTTNNNNAILPSLRWEMSSGDVIVMCGSMQHTRHGGVGWKHGVPPLVQASAAAPPRFNLTFRRGCNVTPDL